MASLSISMVLPVPYATKNSTNLSSSLRPSLPFPQPKKTAAKTPQKRLAIEASLKEEKSVKNISASAIVLTSCYMVLPQVAHAASYDFSPSLKNFLLSIAAGGVVLVAILGAVIGVANFDPVKRA